MTATQSLRASAVSFAAALVAAALFVSAAVPVVPVA